MTQTVQICIRMISPEDVVTDNCRSEFVHVSLWRSLGALPSGGKVSAPETAGLQVLPRGGDLSAIQNRAAELKVLGKNDRYVVDSAITLSLARCWKLFHLNCLLCTQCTYGILEKSRNATLWWECPWIPNDNTLYTSPVPVAEDHNYTGCPKKLQSDFQPQYLSQLRIKLNGLRL